MVATVGSVRSAFGSLRADHEDLSGSVNHGVVSGVESTFDVVAETVNVDPDFEIQPAGGDREIRGVHQCSAAPLPPLGGSIVELSRNCPVADMLGLVQCGSGRVRVETQLSC